MRPLAQLSLRAVGVVAVVLALLFSTTTLTADADQRDRDRPDRSCQRSLPAGTQTLQVRFQGVSYPVRLVVPDGVRTRTALPLVLDLHGSSSNGVAQAPISDLTTLAGEEKFLVANPSGNIALAPQTPPLPDGSWAWNVPGVPTTAGQLPPAGARDDVAFLKTVIKTVDKLACVDGDRVFAAGYSGGGRMASALACELSDTIAAIAPVAGLRAGRPSPVDTSVPEIQSCRPDRPVPVITFHGDADVVNPLPGNSDLRWGYSVAVAVQTWARLNDCRQGPASTTISAQVTRFTYSRCRDGADVAYYRVTGGGHTWPGSAADFGPLGPVNPGDQCDDADVAVLRGSPEALTPPSATRAARVRFNRSMCTWSGWTELERIGPGRAQACARLTAEATAFREALTMLASMPTPHSTCASSPSPTSHSTYAAASASPPAERACSA